MQALKRIAQSADVASVVAFLASDDGERDLAPNRPPCHLPPCHTLIVARPSP